MNCGEQATAFKEKKKKGIFSALDVKDETLQGKRCEVF